LGLVIIDEQHRFGVEQRKKLQAKAGVMPHVLSMTATPIPRSLALTLYGELDISVIDAMPVGRLPIKTKLVSPNSTAKMFENVRAELDRGRQAYVVYPLISDSELLDVKSAEAGFEKLKQGPLKGYRLVLLHGKLRPEQKDKAMRDFIEKKCDVLVSTTVIEVGVDVPNATVMIIEGVERFGLAQIHQLRGRIGRNQEQGYAFLVMSDSKSPSPRLRALEQTSDGFALAELDLRIRGPGAIYGTLQHGMLDLRIAKLTDTKLISSARQAAQSFIDKQEKLKNYSELETRVKAARAVTTLN
jgi:ATP-dependent DNA helicase RecG